MFQSIVFTGRLIKKRPLRSLLTILQIGLGVWIVTTILTMNFQANHRIEAALDKFGENLASINLEKEIIMDEHNIMGENRPFAIEDIIRLKQESPNIDSVFIYENAYSSQLRHNELTYRLRGMAEVSAEALSTLELELVEGYFFTPLDVEQKNPVAVISTDLSKQLFPNQTAVGQTIQIAAIYENEYLPFEIIGVYKPLDPLLQIFFQEATMLIPVGSRESTAERDYSYNRSYYQVYIKSKPGAAYAAVDDAQLILGDDEYQIRAYYLSEYGRAFSSMITGISLFLGALAFVAIIISSLGILSIMLVNVVERTREIGLRKALGASKLSIVHQVLNESFIFSLLGAAVGIVASVLSSGYIIDGLLNQAFAFYQGIDIGKFHPLAALYSCAMALVLGLIFGLYPAVQAARMPAVEALRDA